MKINFWLNGAKKEAEISPDIMLLEFLRSLGCYSVKRGCETANCGLCTVLVNDKPMLSCSVLAARIDGKKVTTMEGLQAEAEEFGTFLANEGAEQCGFCNPGFITVSYTHLDVYKRQGLYPPYENAGSTTCFLLTGMWKYGYR